MPLEDRLMELMMRDEVTAEEARALLAAKKPPKYGNRKIEIDGIRFDSLREAGRYGTLKLMEAAGELTDLEIHPRYELVVNGHRIGRYTADFRYVDTRGGQIVVEDAKGVKTRDYVLRKKLVFALYGIDIVEI